VDTDKALKKLLGKSKNIGFHEFTAVIEAFGFSLSRRKGSHHIFRHKDIPALINVQNFKGQAKPYQIAQFLALVEQYNLAIQEDEQ